MKILFQGAGARPRILERRNGLARGIYNYLFADDRCPGRQILAGAQRFSERHDFGQRALGRIQWAFMDGVIKKRTRFSPRTRPFRVSMCSSRSFA